MNCNIYRLKTTYNIQHIIVNTESALTNIRTLYILETPFQLAYLRPGMTYLQSHSFTVSTYPTNHAYAAVMSLINRLPCATQCHCLPK
jgi:hypothetical protein